MKKLFLAAIFAAGATVLYACDVCGGGAGNSNPFLFPQVEKNFLSIGYTHRVYTDKSHGAAHSQYYNTVLLTGQYSVSKTFQLQGSLPYSYNKIGSTSFSGIGDASVQVNWIAFNRIIRGFRHSVILGAGVKIPTGKFTPSLAKDQADQNNQPGTGSVDYQFNAAYRLGLRSWSLHAMGSYKYNTANNNDYRYGDVLTSGLMAVYRIDRRKYSVSPYLQASYEKIMRDASANILQNSTGGNIIYTGIGADYNTRKFVAGANYQFSPSQNLSGGNLEFQSRYNFRFTFLL